MAAFRKGLNETGYVEGKSVVVEYNWLEGHYDRLPALLTDLIGRRVAVLTTPGSTPGAIAAKQPRQQFRSSSVLPKTQSSSVWSIA